MEKGKVKGIKDSTGSAGNYSAPGQPTTVTITNSRTGVDVDAYVYYAKEQCISVGDLVAYMTINAGGKTTIVGVRRVTFGNISSYDATSAGGKITEKDSLKVIPFIQTNLTDQQMGNNDLVKYDLVMTSNGEVALNLSPFYA